jgi:hypothetical protein
MTAKDRKPRSVTRLVTAFTSDTANGVGYARDLSEGGCRLDSGTPVKRGTYLALHITLADPDGPSLVVPVARVRWVKGHTLGVEFIQIPAENQIRLRHYLTSGSDRARA